MCWPTTCCCDWVSRNENAIEVRIGVFPSAPAIDWCEFVACCVLLSLSLLPPSCQPVTFLMESAARESYIEVMCLVCSAALLLLHCHPCTFS